ncbi:unnamed protein product [Vitrella brassicaformis CCMP3155]|uniref:SAP domain-containing protein n=1 Tax=Vitrella brassicaformis (strain CCMP3155) TaxID=1169540 RepID=A0A0G4FK42_VITBC|nr:unnamed protein product [Vitrella brassicaformis CCMP3155]|eukprot:CEM13925.1 unnamed protein product [Vitrella brassicaformis CCMP3155]
MRKTVAGSSSIQQTARSLDLACAASAAVYLVVSAALLAMEIEPSHPKEEPPAEPAAADAPKKRKPRSKPERVVLLREASQSCVLMLNKQGLLVVCGVVEKLKEARDLRDRIDQVMEAVGADASIDMDVAEAHRVSEDELPDCTISEEHAVEVAKKMIKALLGTNHGSTTRGGSVRLGWDAKQLGFKLKWTGPLPTTPKSKSADDGGDDNTADGAASSENKQPDRDCLIFVFPAQDRYSEEVFFREVTMVTPLTYARLVKALDRALEVRAVLLGADSGRRKRRAAPKAKGKAKAKVAGEKRKREESQPPPPPPSMAAMEEMIADGSIIGLQAGALKAFARAQHLQVTGTKKVLIERIKDQLPFIKGQGTHQKTSAGSDGSQSMPKADGQQGGWE